MNLQLSTSLLGITFALTVLYLVRRDHLHITHAIFWLIFASGGLLFGLFPAVSDNFAAAFGIAYGPAFVLLVALILLVVRCIQADITATKMEREIRHLAQAISLLQYEQTKSLNILTGKDLQKVSSSD
jgi:hypothetical protein